MGWQQRVWVGYGADRRVVSNGVDRTSTRRLRTRDRERLDQRMGKGGDLIMPDFYLPYHFVPVVRGGRQAELETSELRKGKDGNLDGVRHDCYEPGKYSGIIECMAEAVSPLFIGDKRDQTNPEEVVGFKLNGNPALPA